MWQQEVCRSREPLIDTLLPSPYDTQDKRTSASPLPFLEEDNSSVPIVETPLLSTLSLTGGPQVDRPCALSELILLENIPVALDHEGRSCLSEKVGSRSNYAALGMRGGCVSIRRPLPSISSSGSYSIWVLSLEQENWQHCLGTTHLISPLCW